MPRLLDLRKLTEHGGEVSGVIDLDQLPRLADFAGDAGQKVEALLRFFRDEEDRRRIEGEVNTCLQLTCQRCLAPVASEIHTQVRLVVVWGEDEIRQLPEELEPWLAGDEPCTTASLLEEEILLALPLVALHDNCRAPMQPQTPAAIVEPAQRENPFSVLAELKKRQD